MAKLRLPEFLRPSGDLVLGAILFAVTLSIFLLSPVHQVTDSSYSMLLSESLLHHHSFELSNYTIPHLEPKWFGYYFRNGYIYQLELIDGGLYYNFPPGTPVLSAPFVAIMNLLGVSASNADGSYNERGEEKIESVLAAILMAALTCVFFFMARLILPVNWSAIIALAGVLGTQVWSTASRALWSDTWGTLLLGTALFMLLAHETGRRNLKPVLLASVLAWLYFVRPTYSVHIFAITVYLLFFFRRLIIPYLIEGAAWLAGFIFYSWRIYHRLLPSYYQPGRLHFAVVLPGLAGTLFSPARGLLVYVPAILFVGYLLIRYRRQVAFPGLVLMAILVIVCHVFITSASLHWWGGFSFGARFTTGLVPWFVLLAAIGIKAMLARREQGLTAPSWRRTELAFGAALLLFSVTVNSLGAVDQATWKWNTRPVNIDQHAERLWDWRQPQFLAGFLHPPKPNDVPMAPAGRLDFSKAEAEPFLWYGWSPAEPPFRWTEGKEAALVFGVNDVRDMTLTIDLLPFVAPGQHRQQTIKFSVNAHALETLTLVENTQREVTLNLPANWLQPQNTLKINLPDAASPSALALGPDDRLLGIEVYWMEFRPRLR